MEGDVLAVIGLFFVTPALAFGYAAFRLWMQKREAIAPVPLSPALAERLDQLDRQIETLAVEVERMAEGQRFVTRLLAERDPAPGALPPGSTFPHAVHAVGDARPAPVAADTARLPEDR